jgi:3-oxoacyl-[acyl-carrier-protein] synthase III
VNQRLTIPVGITATGQHYPERVVTNDDLAKFLDTTDEWITTRSGIKQRHWVEKGVATSDLAVPALKMALDRRGMSAEELDAIIVATVTPDHFFPSTACLVQHRVGAKNAFGFDLVAACSGFLFALTTGASLVAGKGFKRVAVVGAEVMTSVLDKTDRATAVLFGDGAGAVILEQVEEGFGILDFEHRIDGAGGEFLRMPAGGSRKPASAETVAAKEHYIFQQGQEVFKAAVRGMSDMSRLMLDRNHLTSKDLGLFVAHQANTRIIDAAVKRLELTPDKVMINIDKYGNTTSATIPTALHQAQEQGRLKKGDLVVLTAFGAGWTWGGTLLRWAC